MHLTPTEQNEETTLWTPPKTIEGESPAIFQKIHTKGESLAIFQKIHTKKKRWNFGMEVNYDPVKDEFYDRATQRPVYALLDGEEDAFFDDGLMIESLEFHCDDANCEWIKKGGAGSLDLEKVWWAEKPSERNITFATPPHLLRDLPA